MIRRLKILPYLFLLLLFSSCTSATPAVVPTPTPVVTPSPTLTPSSTPTATPIPQIALIVRWPEKVSALDPAPIAVDLVPPSGVPITATVHAEVLDPEGNSFVQFELLPRGGTYYSSEELLRLPLLPLEGDWQLVTEVEASLPVEGESTYVFQPTPIRFRDLSRHLPVGASLHVPERFAEATVQGDPVAGGHVWRYEGGEVALWWAPGPSEPLLLNNAIVMLETTHDDEEPPTVSEGEEILWQERPGFFFTETWPDEDDVPAQAWVLQGPDYWLYVLRVRPTSDEAAAALLQQVAETFEFVDTP